MEQQQHFYEVDVDILKVNDRDVMLSSTKYDDIPAVTISQLKQKSDDFIRLSSFSSRDLIDILDFSKQIDNKQLPIDAQSSNHKVYSIFSIILKDLLNKWYTDKSFTKFESSYLFPSLIELFCKMNYYSTDLVEPLKKCLNGIAKFGQHLEEIQNMKYLSRLVRLYIENEQIMNTIVNCLCSDLYLKMFRRTERIEKFLLLTCPRYFQDYQGLQKKEMADKLLNTLLKPANQLLISYSKSMEKPVAELLNVLNYSLQLCTATTIFDEDLLLSLVDAVLSIIAEKSLSLQENSLIVKCSIDLLRTIISKNTVILKYVQQNEGVFQRFKELIFDTNENLLTTSKNTFWHEEEQTIDVEELTEITINSKEILDSDRVPNPFFSSIFTSNEHENKEDVTLIWYDENVDVHDDAKKIIELLQQVNDYVLVCSNINTCLEHIDRIQTEKVFVILSGQAVDRIIDKIHDFRQVHSIYIFSTGDTTRYERYVNDHDREYCKLTGIYNEHESLSQDLQQNTYHLTKQLQMTDLFDQYERSVRSLNSESNVFDEFRTFLYVFLKTDYDREQAKKEMIEACRDYYQKDGSHLGKIDEFQREYSSNDAIRWYTKQTFLFNLTNKALRTEDYESLMTLRFFITDLYENLRSKYEDLKQDQQQKDLSIITIYRGVKCFPYDIHILKYSIGKTIATNGFLSTTREKNVAEMFCGVGTTRPGLETVMLEIHVDTTKLTTILADVATYSDFPEEEEVLFALGATFTIDSVTHDSSDNVWSVKLSAVSEDVLTDNIQRLLKSFRNTEMNLIFGELLMRMGRYIQCRKYLESLIDFYGNQHENAIKIKELVAWSYEAEKNYVEAIVHYNEAFERSVALNRWEDASRMTNFIATCYYSNNDKALAQQYNTKAYEILRNQTSLPDNHCQFGTIMLCCGEMKEDNTLAQDYYRKALEIFQNPSTTCQCQSHEKVLAKAYEIIGSRYRKERNYTQTIEYFQEVEKLRRKHITLREEREAYACCLMILKECYTNIYDEIKAQEYLLKYFKFLDNDLIELIYGNNLDAKEGALTLQTIVNTGENQLIYELRLLKLLERTPSNNYQQIIERHLNIGEIYTKTKNHEWAHEHYDKAYNLCQTNASSTHAQAQCLYDIGLRSSAVEDDTEYALKFASAALEIRLLILKSDDVNMGFSYYLMSELDDHLNQYDRGIEHCQKAIKVFEKHLNNEEDYERVKRQYITSYIHIASMYKKKNDFIKSIEYLNIITGYIERYISYIPDGYCFLAKCYNMMAKSYMKLSNNEACLTYLKKFLETTEKYSEVNALLLPLDYNSEISEAFYFLGDSYGAKMDYDQSNFYYEKYIKSPSVDQDKIPTCYSIIGNNYINENCYEKAIENYSKAIDIVESQLPKQLEFYGNCMTRLAMCYAKIGKSQFNFANECMSKVIKIYEQDGNENRAGSAQCYLFYGMTLMLNADYVISREILNKASDLSKDNKPLLLEVYFSLSQYFYETADYQTALTYTDMCMETYRELCAEPNSEYSSRVYSIKAYSFLQLKDFNQALSYASKYQQCVENLSPILTVHKAAACSILALICSKQRKHRKANNYCTTTLNICEQLIRNRDDLTDIGEVFDNIGELFIDRNDFEKAKKYYEEALNFYQQQLIDDHPRIQRVKSIINRIAEIELEAQENMRREPQPNFIGNIYRSANYVSEKMTDLYHTFFPFQ